MLLSPTEERVLSVWGKVAVTGGISGPLFESREETALQTFDENTNQKELNDEDAFEIIQIIHEDSKERETMDDSQPSTSSKPSKRQTKKKNKFHECSG